jgi:hypothetical protein
MAGPNDTATRKLHSLTYCDYEHRVKEKERNAIAAANMQSMEKLLMFDAEHTGH